MIPYNDYEVRRGSPYMCTREAVIVYVANNAWRIDRCHTVVVGNQVVRPRTCALFLLDKGNDKKGKGNIRVP